MTVYIDELRSFFTDTRQRQDTRLDSGISIRNLLIAYH